MVLDGQPLQNKPERLFTRDFIFVCIANFCMFFAFYMILPALPVYLVHHFDAGKATIGIILASYSIATLIVRPFSGFLTDMLPRKMLYMVAYFLFIVYFLGYLFAGTLLVIAIVRATHGLFYGTVTTASGTLAIDIMPSSRRGTGLGYFGSTSTLAMAFGPMVGLFLVEQDSFDTVFYLAIISGVLGLILASFIKTKKRPTIYRAPISTDRFFLIKGIIPAIALLLFSYLYGVLSSYTALFGMEIGIEKGTGKFWTLYACGLIISRFNAGKFIDKGLVTQMIVLGNIIAVAAFALLALTANHYVFFGTAIAIGFGIGMTLPSYQTLFISLAPNSQRGTANATYLMAWDIGAGLGIWVGALIADVTSWHFTYQVTIIPAIISIITMWKIVTPWYQKNKLQSQ
jgi:MFS family permease